MILCLVLITIATCLGIQYSQQGYCQSLDEHSDAYQLTEVEFIVLVGYFIFKPSANVPADTRRLVAKVDV